MLPRISAALAKFLTPITSSIFSSTDSPKDPYSPRKHNPSKKQKPAHPHSHDQQSEFQENTEKGENKGRKVELKVISSSSTTSPTPSQSNQKNPENSNTFLKIFSLFQRQGGGQSRNQGKKNYEAALRAKKKSGNFRKGAMLDEKAE